MKKFKFAAIIAIILLFATALSACTQKTAKTWSFVSDGKIVATIDKDAALPTLSNKEGFLFEGWFLADGTKVTEEYFRKYQNAASLTVYAKWERHTHEYVPTVVAPTCTEAGYTHNLCTCGDFYDEAGEAALGHDFEEKFTVDVKPTCLATGQSSRHCTRCKEVTDVTELPLSDHTYTSIYNEETHWRECSVCGIKTEAVAHSFSWEVVVAPNCVATGLKHEFCSCGIKRSEKTEIPVVKHASCNTAWQSSKTNHWKYCDVVKEKFYDAPHTYVSGICSVCEFLNENNALAFTLINEDKEYKVSGGTLSDATVNIPKTYLSKPVTAIADKAFENFKITSITLSENITHIGEAAFKNCAQLAFLTIPQKNALTEIGKEAFYGATSLNTPTLPNGVTSIGAFAYANSGVVNVVIPMSVTKIGEGVFAYCKNLDTIVVDDKNTYFRAVTGCLIQMGDRIIIAAAGTAVIPQDTSNTIYGIAPYAFAGSIISRINIPDSVTSMGAYAFDGCEMLGAIVVPSRIGEIGFGAFRGCTALTTITLPYIGAEFGAENVPVPDGAGGQTLVERVHFGYIFGAKSYKDNTTLVPENLKKVVMTGGMVVGENAFYGCSNLISVELPSSLIMIEAQAFYGCVSIAELVVPNSVKSIFDGALEGCSGLTVLTIPFVGQSRDAKNSNTTGSGTTEVSERTNLGFIFGAKSAATQSANIPTSLRRVVIADADTIAERAFYGANNVQSVELCAKLTTIGAQAFENCERLSAVTFEGSSKLISIGNYAFKNCKTLLSLSVPESVTRIGLGALEGCVAIKTLALPFIGEGKEGTENTHLAYIFGVLRSDLIDDFNHIGVSVVDSAAKTAIPASLESLALTGSTVMGDYALYGASKLRIVRLPKGLLKIGNYAFYGCAALSEIDLPETLQSIGDGAFGYCSALVKMAILKNVTSIGDGIFRYCQTLDFITVHTENTVFYAKDNCLIERASKKVLAGSKKAIIPTMEGHSIAEIGRYAFSGIALTSVVLPSTLTVVGDYAFKDCSSLVSVDFPTSVVWFGQDVLGGCVALTSLSAPYLGEAADVAAKSYLGYLFGAPSADKQNEYLPQTLISVKLYAGAKIADRAFYGCARLQTIVLGETERIGAQAFYGCSSLTKMDLPASVTEIGAQAFYDCYSMASISFADATQTQKSKLTVIGTEAFRGCRNLTSVTLPATVSTLGERSFFGNTALADVSFENGSKLVSLNEDVFAGCINLAAVSFGDNSRLRTISAAFLGAQSLQSVAFGANSVLELIGSSAFAGCGALQSITLPQTVTSIGWGAFLDCTSLQEIVVPANTLYIGGSAFKNCSALRSVVDIPVSVGELFDNVFAYCTKLSTISYKGTMEQWNAIEKSDQWDAEISGFTISCTNGNISK